MILVHSKLEERNILLVTSSDINGGTWAPRTILRGPNLTFQKKHIFDPKTKTTKKCSSAVLACSLEHRSDVLPENTTRTKTIMHVSHLRHNEVGVGWGGNTHTLIKTTRLEACIGICAPPPTHTQFGIDTTHNIRCQGWGGWGKRPTTSTAQTAPERRAIQPPPPFPCCGLGCGVDMLVVLKVREGIHYLFAGVLLFLNWLNSKLN